MNLNKVMLAGNLTRDPECRYTPKGTAVCDFSVAVNRKWSTDRGEGEETFFGDCTAWGKTAENIDKFFSKGKPIFIEGRLQLDTWEDKNTGQTRSKVKIIVENFHFVGSKDSHESPRPQSDRRPPAQDEQPSFDDDDDVPF